MAEVLRWAQKYINLEVELEVEWLRKIANFNCRILDDSSKHDKVHKASQWWDLSGRNNTYNDAKDAQILSSSLTSNVNYLE